MTEPSTASSGAGVPKIPATGLLLLYRLLRLMTQAERLAMAGWLAREPEVLASMFSRSVKLFGSYSNPERFHGRRAREPDPPTTLRTGRDAINHLWHLGGPGRTWSVEGDDDLDFRVVDYEVEVTRTTRSPGFTDGTPSTAGLTTDLLLAGRDGRPIVCEVKAGTAHSDDTDPFLALVQALAAAAHLSTDSQRARLAEHYGVRSDNGRIDVYVVMARTARRQRSRHQDDLYVAARTLADGLGEQAGLARHVRRIAFVGARPAGDTLVLRHRDEPLWPPRADVLASRADAELQRDHDAEAARSDAGGSTRGCAACGASARALE